MNPVPSEALAPPARHVKYRVLLALVTALLLAAAGVSYVGIQHQTLSEPSPRTQSSSLADPVVRIELPHEDFAVPPGPHSERFQVTCTVCHSPRLAFTQPPLPERKWQEVVHKMVAAYGAPLTVEEDHMIASYLSAVHGPADR